MIDREINNYWKTIMETLPDGLMVVDPRGIIVYVNSTMVELVGYSRKELIGSSCELLCCDACVIERKGTKDAFCTLFAEQRIRRLKCALKRKDGRHFHAMKNASVLTDSRQTVMGAVETFTDIHEILDKENEIRSLRSELTEKNSFHGLIGASSGMLGVFRMIESAAASDAPVLILGESGVGKELAASAVHRLSHRKNGPFVKVNCTALNESLLESELFGHVKGAFTGAEKNRKGRFEASEGGSIFLDEIGDIPPSVQVKLLRVLQEKEIERVGDNTPVPVNTRFISATNRNLQTLMEEKAFRDDLYYRVSVIPVPIPPLRKRREDIPLLLNTFINRQRLKTGKPIMGLSKEAFERMMSHTWPGNIRELMNALEYAFVICSSGEIRPEHLPMQFQGNNTCAPACFPQLPEQNSSGNRGSRKNNAPARADGNERKRLVEALKTTNGNKTKAAQMLNISRVALYNRLKKYNIQVDTIISDTSLE